ncbi:MAG: methyl-accepting chemotaxis protein [Pseudomonadota bacterium]
MPAVLRILNALSGSDRQTMDAKDVTSAEAADDAAWEEAKWDEHAIEADANKSRRAETEAGADVPQRRKSDPIISDLARRTGHLGREIVEVVAFIDDLDVRSQTQQGALSVARQNADAVVDANHSISTSLEDMRKATSDVEALVGSSEQVLQISGQHCNEIVDHVMEINQHMGGVLEALQHVQEGNQSIRDIAKTVHLLAINARIEASRAGDAGAGFATIASAINELANTTSTTVDAVQGSVEELTEIVRRLSDGSQTAGTKSDEVIASNTEMSSAMGEITHAMRGLTELTGGVVDKLGRSQSATEAFEQAFHDIETTIADTNSRVSQMRERTANLVDQTETMVQDSVSIGAKTDDSPFIERVQTDAAKIAQLFEAAIDNGTLTTADLFSKTYTTIPGTDPEQVMTRFTLFTDKVLPPIQEDALEHSERVIFCAAVNIDGYLPTHNRKFSKPQGEDPAWNTGHCRNRRIFNDRVGLKAGQNTKPFLLQVYRRDMGGGVFKVMKDVSAPIMVHGRHWGGLRLAYEV